MEHVKYAELVINLLEKGDKVMFTFAAFLISTLTLNLYGGLNLYLSIGLGILIGMALGLVYGWIKNAIVEHNRKTDPKHRLERLFNRLKSERNFRLQEMNFAATHGKLEPNALKEFLDFCDEKLDELETMGLDQYNLENAIREIDQTLLDFKKDFIEANRENQIAQKSLAHSWLR